MSDYSFFNYKVFSTQEKCQVCPSGYYCESRTAKIICPVNHMCPIRSTSPTQCPDGSHQPETGRAYCDSCPMGYYCKNMEKIICPSGHF